MSVSAYAEQFPWDKVDAAKRYLYMVKPWWARFGQRLKVVPVYQRPPEGKPYGSITSTDGGFRLYIDTGFASWAPLHLLAGAIEHEFQHHTRDSWSRMKWLSVEDWSKWANVALDLEINSGIEYESNQLDMQKIRVAAQKSNVFVEYELDFWSVTEPPNIGEEGWLPRLMGLPDRLSAEEYLGILQTAHKEPPPPPPPLGESEDGDQNEDQTQDQKDNQESEETSEQNKSESSEGQDEDNEESLTDDENSDVESDDDQNDASAPTEDDQDSDEDGDPSESDGSNTEDDQDSDGQSPDSSDDESDDQSADDSEDNSGDDDDQGSEEQDGSGEGSGSGGDSPDAQSGDESPDGEAQQESEKQGNGSESKSLAETFAELKTTGDRRIWSAEIGNPQDDLLKPAWKPEDRKNEKPLDRASIESALIELEEDIREFGSETGISPFGLHPGNNMLQWVAKRRRMRGVDWQSRLNKLLSSNYTSAKVHGASDLSYTVRNPNQPEFGVILQGLHDYAPKVFVIQDVSGSMISNDGMNKSMSLFTDLCSKVLGRFNSPVTWVTVDAGIIDVGSASSWSNHQQKRWAYGFGGTEIAPAIEQVMTGKMVWKGKKYPKADLTVIVTDCIFQWPERRPIRNGKLLIISVEPDRQKINKFLPPWVDRKRELIVIED